MEMQSGTNKNNNMIPRFKQYLEEKKETIKDIFQKELFGDFFMKDEDDTEKENDIFMSLQKFIKQNKLDADILHDLKILKKAKPHYKSLLEPKAKRVYRGTVISKKQFKEIKWKPVTRGGVAQYKGKMIYKAHRNVQSFTTKWNIAEDFIEQNVGGELNIKSKGKIPAILSIAVNSNDFMLTTKLSNKFWRQSPEYEIIRMVKNPIEANIFISSVAYWNHKDD